MTITVGCPQTNRKTDTGKTLKPWPVLVDHYISGDLTYEQGRSEIFAYYTKSDTAGPVTVGEVLAEEFLKPLNMSHDELAEAMGICKQCIDDIICGLHRLTDDEARVLAVIFGTDEDFWSNLQMLQDRPEQRRK